MKSPDIQDLVKEIALNCYSVRLRLLNRVVGAIFDEALRPHEIRASQLNILVAVAAYGPVTSQQLCRVLHMDASTFSRAISRLKAKLWIEIEPSGEGKVLLIRVGSAGLEKIKCVYPDWQKAQEKVASVLGESTVEKINASGDRYLLKGMTG
jgi:DNA-binding MarR family transcriptional regulator